MRHQVYNKFKGRCAYCGCSITLKEMQVDHFIPLYRNDKGIEQRKIELDKIENLMPACRQCNLHKSTFSIEVFRSEIQDQVNRARRYSRNFRIAERFGLVEEKQTKVEFYFELQTSVSQ